MSASPLLNSTSAWASVFILTSLENRLNQNGVSACACQPVYLCLHPAFSPAPEDSLSALLLVCWIPLLLTHSRALSLHLFPLCHSSWAFSSLSDHSYHQNQSTASLKKKKSPSSSCCPISQLPPAAKQLALLSHAFFPVPLLHCSY